MRKLILMLCLVMSAFMAQAQSDDIMKRGQAAAKAGGAELANFKKELVQLSKSSKEKDVINALYGYYGLGDKKEAKALSALIAKKFPKGIIARGKALSAMMDIQDVNAKEKAYKAWLKKFPPKKFRDDGATSEAAFFLAEAFAKAGQTDKALEYLSQCTSPAWRSWACSYIAPLLVKAGKNEAAGKMLKECCEIMDKSQPTLKDSEKRQAETVYAAYADWLADNGQADEAWKLYTTKVDERQRGLGYWKLAATHGQVMQAWTYLDNILRKGYADKEIEDGMKQIWAKVNGSADGFDNYVKSVNQDRINDMIAKLPEKMTDKPAPDFTLKDIDGNTVQLSKLHGKVVVLDFWATWCGPCKRSLPAMKMAVDKYKNDSDVVFLFIHTWERGTAEQANKDAKAYLHDHGFDEFHLVMDTVNPKTKKNDAVSAYGVDGIPAKFIIDKQGKIRFNISGFGGSDEDAVAELSAMIEMAKKNS